MESVTIPDDVVSMESSVFSGCSHLQTVQWSEELHTIPSGTFYDCSRLKFDIPEHITSIGEDAFHGCESITRFDIPAGVTSIGTSAFSNTGITDLPDNLPYITSYMFAGCDQLVNVDIPEGIEEIGDYAFRYCSSLRSITAPASVKEAGSTLSEGCPQLSYVIWKSAQAEAPYFGDADNLLVYLPNGGSSHSSNQNIINKGRAASIHLTYQSAAPFYCPEPFTADYIEITQNYGKYYWWIIGRWEDWTEQYTGTGVAARWRSISLPFTVTSIKSEEKGELAPFHSEKQESGDAKPFWLCEMTADDFQPATQIEAYKPYLLAMPNNPEYMDEYNITDNVTFSATNAVVGKTPDAIDSSPVGKGGWALTPVFAKVAKSLDIYCLNEELFVKNGVDYPVGSCFRSNDRSAYTFEAIVKIDGGAARSILPLGQNLSRGAARPLGRVPQPEDMPLP